MLVSFLICAHNEEKVIGNALKNITKIDYKKKEILVGIDGCTDRTEEVVRNYRGVRIIKGRKRLGKAALLGKLIRESRGEIIVIHDADWLFVSPPGKLNKMVDLFRNDPKLGGVDFPHPHPYCEDPKKAKKVKSLLFIGSSWGSKLITEFQWEKYGDKFNGKRYVNPKKIELPIPVGVFRKGIINHFDVLNEDALICMKILKKGYKILLLNRNYPYFVVTDQQATIKGIFRQKMRTSIGWKQIENDFPKVSMAKIYPKLILYFIKRYPQIVTFRAKIGFLLWLLLTIAGTIKGKMVFNNFDTVKAWSFRATRHGTQKYQK